MLKYSPKKQFLLLLLWICPNPTTLNEDVHPTMKTILEIASKDIAIS